MNGKWLTGFTVEDPFPLKEIIQAYLCHYSMTWTDWLVPETLWHQTNRKDQFCQFCITTVPNMQPCLYCFCAYTKMQRTAVNLMININTHLFDTAGVLLHSYLFHSALKAEEGLDVQAGTLFKTSPVLILWVNLYQHTQTLLFYCTHMKKQDDWVTMVTTHPVSLDVDAYREQFSHCAQWVGVCVSVCPYKIIQPLTQTVK